MNKNDYTVRELKAGETGKALEFRNSIFTPVSRERYDDMGCTASVALKGKQIHGLIPLQFREYVLRPGLSIPVVFENAVGVHEKARGTGIGTAMIEKAADFTADRVDALFVCRGGEQSPAYRFYRKTHHGDLFYETRMVLEKPKGKKSAAEEISIDRLPVFEKQMLSLFGESYRGFGGFWKRRAGYYRNLTRTHIYGSDEWKLLVKRRGKKISGYMIVNPADDLIDGVVVYDYAAESPKVMTDLIQRAEWMAKKKNTSVKLTAVNIENPFFQTFLKAGFRAVDNTPYVMARITVPSRLFERLAGNKKIRQQLALTVKTPHRETVLNAPEKPVEKVTLYMKEAQFSRLMCCRLDLKEAVRTNLVRVSPVSQKILNQLARVFAFTPWVNFRSDYV